MKKTNKQKKINQPKKLPKKHTNKNNQKRCEEWDAKFQAEGWSTLSLCVKGHINKQESISSNNPEGRGKLMGRNHFPLKFFLDLSI